MARSPGIFRCPSDVSTLDKNGVAYPFGGSGFPRVRSMSMNAWIGTPLVGASVQDLQVPQGNFRIYDREGDLQAPGAANLWLMLDENPASINDGWVVINAGGSKASPPTAWSDTPATYHNNAGGLNFCDGHAQIRKWTDPYLINRGHGGAAETPGGSLDFKWLWARTTLAVDRTVFTGP